MKIEWIENGDLPASPTTMEGAHGSTINTFGLTKREYFAAKAMQGLLSANPEGLHGNVPIPVSEDLAKWAVLFADALLTQLSKHNE